MAPTTSPSTRTDASATRAATALTPAPGRRPTAAAEAAGLTPPRRRAGLTAATADGVSSPCRTSSRTAGSVAATSASVGRSCAIASSSTSSPSAQRALAARQQVRGRPVHLVAPPRPVLSGHRGAHRRPPLGARLRPALQQHRRGERQPGGQQRRVVGVGAQPVDAVEPALHLRPERVVERLGEVLEHHRGRAVGAPQREHPEADRLDRRPVHPVQPLPRLRAPGGRGRVERRRRAATCRRAAPGSATSRCTTHASQPAGSQDRTRSGQSSPRTCSHDASSWATPPGARCPARSPTSAASAASPSAPESR